MVYCGPPSKGCASCRERKVRCDQKEPSCGQCEKRNVSCPGYRNMQDLMFRDESSHVIKKAKARARKKDNGGTIDIPLRSDRDCKPSSSGTNPAAAEKQSARKKRSSPLTPETHLSTWSSTSPSSRSDSSSSSDESKQDNDQSLIHAPQAGTARPRSPVLSLLYALSPTQHEKGTAFFFSRYVAIDKYACHQRFDFIYDIWTPGTLAPEHNVDSVMASITAVGLVGLSNLTSSPEVLENARKSYISALRLINNALRAPTEAIKDTTMLSILILGLFELIADSDARNIKPWQEHVNGAAALAKLRGVSQFQTRAGSKMFNMLCQMLMVSCIQQGIPMPQPLLDLRAELATKINSPKSSIEVSMPIFRVLQFRSEVQSGRLPTPEAIIDRLIEMDNEFKQVTARLPASWIPRVFKLSQPHRGVFGGIYNVYPSMDKAAIWNGIWSCRMLITETILTEIYCRFKDVVPSEVPPNYVRAFREARTELSEMCVSIVATVPQHAGLIGTPDSTGLFDTTTGIPTMEIPAYSSGPAAAPTNADGEDFWKSGYNTGYEFGDFAERTIKPVPDDSGPTLLDPVRAIADPMEEAHRLMLLVSAGNNIVWPLYHVGMSSVCPPAMKAYCIERLDAVYKESGLRQASAIATIIANREVIPQWLELSFADGY
ncbi:hypothetical protein MCOR03_009423 [Pyricularia oryzae]|nr:hypothetical protein MCOR26_010771 [Pyricularia oryzae]KAI6317151.1 hypothetical protein MCOR30_009143 [Pyricularia oryzae]KAI6331838.1 hypothetical protein MCOR28_011147 [Pyricularia oryzae]KAI6395810.1 hypothetical protein MCOR20_010118 [Pyricularia oryzae]KAI6450121.1 hypothetical protein MCOR15_009497 [Pyricularia oryzae]